MDVQRADMVVFDTCVLTRLEYDSPVWELITAIFQAGVVRFGLPETVLQELLAQREREYISAVRTAEVAWERLQRHQEERHRSMFPAVSHSRDHVRRWENLYRRSCEELPLSGESAREALRREVHRIRPAKESGKSATGSRDAAIWLATVDYARKYPGTTTYFVSSNPHDFGPDDQLFPELQDDVRAAGVRVEYLSSLNTVLDRFGQRKSVPAAEAEEAVELRLKQVDVLQAIQDFVRERHISDGFKAWRSDPQARQLATGRWTDFDGWLEAPAVKSLGVAEVATYAVGGKTFVAATARIGVCGLARQTEARTASLAVFAVPVRLLFGENSVTTLSGGALEPLTPGEAQHWQPERPFLSAGAALTEYADLYDPLLEWVYERARESDLGDVDILPFAEENGLTAPQAFALLRYAKGKGTVDDRYSTMGIPAANLTPQGINAMEERRRRRSSPVARSMAARRALLNWLWAQKDEGVEYPVVADILSTQESMFEGARLTVEDIGRAATYLDGKGLIRGVYIDQQRAPVKAEITAEGQDCVEHFDGDSGAYEQRHRGTVYNNFLPNAKGVIIGEQQNFTQNNTDGVDPTLFVQLAGYVGQVSGTLGMLEPDRMELERVARDLHAEATSPNPEPGRLRQLANQVKDKLLAAGTTMAATMGVQMAEQALGALMQ